MGRHDDGPVGRGAPDPAQDVPSGRGAGGRAVAAIRLEPEAVEVVARERQDAGRLESGRDVVARQPAAFGTRRAAAVAVGGERAHIG